MNISTIKSILSGDHVAPDEVNPIIDGLKVEDLGQLTQYEKEVLQQILSNILVLVQDTSSGAHLDDPKRAESLLSALSE